ncbi:LCP family protein [Ureibacillus sinduriensis]|uniref:Transcriptional regulator n=1 Tax=Ureibacillus sinduriensis BLB-1 = JCM 15800 TaxID=1384057 RepID=A0A0A3I372_9BACL|nr:LCP family protein [Ureibacillus sinduriensis]KGR77945.1 transcriptional regulator [Ureibacillus sinduriensis BLB-1 = JCM 15800]
MVDKRLKKAFSNVSDRELQFTKENRDRVFEQIHKIDESIDTQKKSLISVKKLAPVTVSLLVLGLCLFLFIPSLLSGGLTRESGSSDFNKGPSTSVASDSIIEEDDFFTTLITVKSKEMENRIYVNLLLTYNKDKKMMKVVSLPYDTYVPVAENEDGTTLYDKLLLAYNFGGAENVSIAVSKLLDMPIDYYAVVDLDTISTLINSMNGIEYNLQEDTRLRAITQVAVEFEKGTHHLNGEEFIALLMNATEGNNFLGEEDLVNLLNTVLNKLEDEIPPTQLKELFTQIEANTSLDHLLDNHLEVNSIKSVSLIDGMISDAVITSNTEGKHIYKFEKEFLNSVSRELTIFN